MCRIEAGRAIATMAALNSGRDRAVSERPDEAVTLPELAFFVDEGVAGGELSAGPKPAA